MAVACRDVVEVIEKLAPQCLAADWDNVGLQVGRMDSAVTAVLVTLEINAEVVREATSSGAEMIVCHHPIIFKPMKNVRFDRAPGDVLARLIKNDIQVLAAHTNLDHSANGTSFFLAEKLGLKNSVVLEALREELQKLVVFVPDGHEQDVLKAMGDAGAGHIGGYSHCSFRTQGTGTFTPEEGANPFLGMVGRLENATEWRIETIFPKNLRHRVINAMLESHPYEEAAYDIYRMENPGPSGLGRVGFLEEEMTLRQFAERVGVLLETSGVRYAGNPDFPVRKVAVCGGAGADLIGPAMAAGADVLVTGDVKYHEALEAKANGFNVVDAGHNPTERVLVPGLARYLEAELNDREERVAVFTSETNTDPWEGSVG